METPGRLPPLVGRSVRDLTGMRDSCMCLDAAVDTPDLGLFEAEQREPRKGLTWTHLFWCKRCMLGQVPPLETGQQLLSVAAAISSTKHRGRRSILS